MSSLHSNVSFDRSRLHEGGNCRFGRIGKTQVAFSFANSIFNDHPEFTVFWISALSVESFEQACGKIAGVLSMRSALREKEDVKMLVQRHFSATSAGRWVLIVDNVNDISFLEGSETVAGLLEHLPESDLGLTMFTTRSYEVAQSLVGRDVDFSNPTPGFSLCPEALYGNNESLTV